MLLNNPSTFRDTSFWWICFPNGLIMETISPPPKKKKNISTKNRHIFRVASTDRLARRSVTSIPSGGSCFFPLAWMPVNLDRWLDWVGKLILSNGGPFSAFALRPFSSSSFWTPTGAAVFWCVFFFCLGYCSFFDLPKIFPEKMFVQQSYLQTATLKMLFWIKSCCFSFHPLTHSETEDRYPKWRHVWNCLDTFSKAHHLFFGNLFVTCPGCTFPVFFSSRLVVKC